MLDVGLHLLELLAVEPPGLEEDAVGDADLPDVVKERPLDQRAHVRRRQPDLLADPRAQDGHPVVVGVRVSVALGDGVPERLERVQVGVEEAHREFHDPPGQVEKHRVQDRGGKQDRERDPEAGADAVAAERADRLRGKGEEPVRDADRFPRGVLDRETIRRCGFPPRRTVSLSAPPEGRGTGWRAAAARTAAASSYSSVKISVNNVPSVRHSRNDTKSPKELFSVFLLKSRNASRSVEASTRAGSAYKPPYRLVEPLRLGKDVRHRFAANPVPFQQRDAHGGEDGHDKGGRGQAQQQGAADEPLQRMPPLPGPPVPRPTVIPRIPPWISIPPGRKVRLMHDALSLSLPFPCSPQSVKFLATKGPFTHNYLRFPGLSTPPERRCSCTEGPVRRSFSREDVP